VRQRLRYITPLRVKKLLFESNSFKLDGSNEWFVICKEQQLNVNYKILFTHDIWHLFT